MKTYQISAYAEAVQVVEEIGILPLSPLIPNYPALDNITPQRSWHTGLETDPWLWRAWFPADGAAAYGKFFKKKGVLISRHLFPVVVAVLSSTDSVSSRYKKGLLSKAAVDVYDVIRSEEGIETRTLRAKAGLKAKEQKAAFDLALAELQGSLDIVISGVKERRNALGEKNGWNSTSFETTSHWMKGAGIEPFKGEANKAKEQLRIRLSETSSGEAVTFFQKLFAW